MLKFLKSKIAARVLPGHVENLVTELVDAYIKALAVAASHVPELAGQLARFALENKDEVAKLAKQVQLAVGITTALITKLSKDKQVLAVIKRVNTDGKLAGDEFVEFEHKLAQLVELFETGKENT